MHLDHSDALTLWDGRGGFGAFAGVMWPVRAAIVRHQTDPSLMPIALENKTQKELTMWRHYSCHSINPNLVIVAFTLA